MLTGASAKAPGQDDLFTEEVSRVLPARLAVEGKILGSATRQQAVPAARTLCRLRPFTVRRVGGFETTLKSGETLKILSAKTATMLDADLVLLVPDPISLQILGGGHAGSSLERPLRILRTSPEVGKVARSTTPDAPAHVEARTDAPRPGCPLGERGLATAGYAATPSIARVRRGFSTLSCSKFAGRKPRQLDVMTVVYPEIRRFWGVSHSLG